MTSTSDDESGSAGYRFPAWLRRTTVAAVVIVLALAAVAVAGVVVARSPLPRTAGELTLRGLDESVVVRRDAHGIPQLYAETAHDLFYAQGFVQAQDRFWEMDFRRHVTSGRLSELFGEDTLETDMFVRTMGWREVARQEYDLISEETRDYLQAYSAGVNAYLADRPVTKMSVEYSLLGLTGLDYTPEQWTPVDSLAWLKAMAWDLRGNMEDEIARARLSVDLTPGQVDELYPDYPYDTHAPIVSAPKAAAAAAAPAAGAATSAPVVKEGAQQRTLGALQRAAEQIPQLLGQGDGLGSNSWAVSGRLTTSGKPLLANDPHLGVSQPGIWYQMGLHCTTVNQACPFDVSGFTFSGVPGVIIGHNDEIAWGLTNLGPDVTDLYLEKVEGHTSLHDGAAVALEEKDETVKIKGQAAKTFTVRKTRHGPLISDVSRELSSVGANAPAPEGSPARGNGYAVALAWTALTPRPTMDAVFEFNLAQDFDQFRSAATKFAVPGQNLVYADRAGNIGYQATGAIPIRRPGETGNYPVPGWVSTHDWLGEVPFESLPHVLNPPEGFIVTANQAVTGPDDPSRLHGAWDQGYRSQRIRDLLITEFTAGQVGVEEMAAVQSDTRHPMAPVLVPLLQNQLLPSSYYADGQRLLADWDFSQPADSAAAAYFNVVWSNLLRLTFDDQLPQSQRPDGSDRWMAVMTRLLSQPNSSWWDDSTTERVVENRDMVVSEAMRQARGELVRRQSLNPERWTWGHLHRLRLEDQSLGASGIGLVERLLNRGPYLASGGASAVNATDWDAREGYEVTTAPSMRMVVDLDDLDASIWVNLTGASGHALASTYDDQTELWLEGRSLPWAYGEPAVRAATEDTLTLNPE